MAISKGAFYSGFIPQVLIIVASQLVDPTLASRLILSSFVVTW